MPILKADFPMMKTIIAAFALPLFLLAASPAPASETSGAPAASEAQSKLAPESDPREEWNTAKEDFEKLED